MDTIEVEIAYARPERQSLIPVRVPRGATAADAVRASGILAEHPEIEWPGAPLGIFGEKIAADHELAPGDRVEIYRPLTLDPKEARRRRAAGKRGGR